MDPLTTSWLSYGEGAAFSGYLAHPTLAKGPLPGVLVVHEALGVNAHIEDVTRRFASAGYAAFAPDLFSRSGKRPPALEPARLSAAIDLIQRLSPAQRGDPAAREAAIDALPPERAAEVRETVVTLFAGGHFPPLLAASAFLREELPVTRGQKIVSAGFCMGGGLSMLLACKDEQLAGALSFYGRPPPPEDIPGISCPILAFYGNGDLGLVQGLPALQAAMQSAGKAFESVVYDGAEHAFFNDTRPLYDVRAARDSFARALAFLRVVLG